jgi:hypothetical protein
VGVELEDSRLRPLDWIFGFVQIKLRATACQGRLKGIKDKKYKGWGKIDRFYTDKSNPGS